MRIVIETLDTDAAVRLTNESPPDGVKVSFHFQQTRDFSPEPQLIQLIIEIPVGIVVGLFTSWLYDMLKKGKSKTVIINRREVVIEEGEIRKVIDETTRIKE